MQLRKTTLVSLSDVMADIGTERQPKMSQNYYRYADLLVNISDVGHVEVLFSPDESG
jgi:hypothetical protein